MAEVLSLHPDVRALFTEIRQDQARLDRNWRDMSPAERRSTELNCRENRRYALQQARKLGAIVEAEFAPASPPRSTTSFSTDWQMGFWLENFR